MELLLYPFIPGFDRINLRPFQQRLEDALNNRERGEIELPLANAMHQLDARNRRRGASEPLETKHDLRPGFDVAMVLLDQVVRVLRRSNLGVRRQQAAHLHFTHGAVRGRIAVESDGFRWLLPFTITASGIQSASGLGSV